MLIEAQNFISYFDELVSNLSDKEISFPLMLKIIGFIINIKVSKAKDLYNIDYILMFK